MKKKTGQEALQDNTRVSDLNLKAKELILNYNEIDEESEDIIDHE